MRRQTKCPGYRPTQSFILHTFNAETVKPGIIKEDENRYKYTNHKNQGAVILPEDGRPVDALVPRQISPVAIDRIQHVSNFLSMFLPKCEADALTPPSKLIFSLPDIPASRTNFLVALDAVSSAQLTIFNKSHSLIHRSRSLYGTALGQLITSIKDPRSAQEIETLLSTYLCALYEVYQYSSDGCWAYKTDRVK